MLGCKAKISAKNYFVGFFAKPVFPNGHLCTELTELVAGKPRAVLDAELTWRGNVEAAKLNARIRTLELIAMVSPLLGLLGTVIGMIEIFGSQGGDGGMGAVPGGGNPAQLANGISIALYNTAFGLIVAIPALIFWRYFRARVDDYLLSMELAAERFARHLVSLRK